MDHRNSSQTEQNVIAERAAEWLDRLKSGEAQDKRQFFRWLRRSPEHVGEVLLATGTDIVLRRYFRGRKNETASSIVAANNVVELEPTARPLPPARTHRRLLRFSAVGGAMAAALLLLILQPGPIRQWLHPNLYTTAIGEQRFVELADGSSISINAQSTVRIAFSEKAREVYLNDGQALFTVAKDAARPFRVHVDNNVVQALGTKFDVWRHSGDITVAVIEGAVQVNSGLQAPRRVSAGQRVSVVANREITAPQAVNVADVSAWQQRRLVFSDSTLADIAEEFARYNRKPQIRIEGEALRARKLSAVFNADNPEGLLIFLASDHSVRFDHQGDTIVIRSTSSAPAQYSPAGPSP